MNEILLNRDYIYAAGIPKDCHGSRYRAHRRVVDVPTYQQKVLVEALDGPDAGLWFTCSVDNFSRRYKLAEDAPCNSPTGIVG